MYVILNLFLVKKSWSVLFTIQIISVIISRVPIVLNRTLLFIVWENIMEIFSFSSYEFSTAVLRLKSLADLWSRDKGKNASNTCSYTSNIFLILNSSNSEHCPTIFDFQQRGEGCTAPHPPSIGNVYCIVNIL